MPAALAAGVALPELAAAPAEGRVRRGELLHALRARAARRAVPGRREAAPLRAALHRARVRLPLRDGRHARLAGVLRAPPRRHAQGQPARRAPALGARPARREPRQEAGRARARPAACAGGGGGAGAGGADAAAPPLRRHAAQGHQLLGLRPSHRAARAAAGPRARGDQVWRGAAARACARRERLVPRRRLARERLRRAGAGGGTRLRRGATGRVQ
mmetsp:Transcript_16048/g.38347  ORF Transcript_16048/g.38347 Transcript_16048/m.38347 type:complete len:216 (-) Transcript_16048:125-772(-)